MDIGMILLRLFALFMALTFHEFAHGWIARKLGDRTAEFQGRLSLNPKDHIDPFGTVLLPLMLGLAGLPIFGYARPVPVQLGALRRYRLAHILISAAGPAATLLQAAICMALLVFGYINGDNFALIVTTALGMFAVGNSMEWFSSRSYSAGYSGGSPSRA